MDSIGVFHTSDPCFQVHSKLKNQEAVHTLELRFQEPKTDVPGWLRDAAVVEYNDRELRNEDEEDEPRGWRSARITSMNLDGTVDLLLDEGLETAFAVPAVAHGDLREPVPDPSVHKFDTMLIDVTPDGKFIMLWHPKKTKLCVNPSCC